MENIVKNSKWVALVRDVRRNKLLGVKKNDRYGRFIAVDRDCRQGIAYKKYVKFCRFIYLFIFLLNFRRFRRARGVGRVECASSFVVNAAAV